MKARINTYSILGKEYESKPLKLQLNKDSYSLIHELTEYIKSEAELSAEELKDSRNAVIISLVITGFLSSEENCSRVLNTFINSSEDWNQIISNNRDKLEEIKSVSMKIINDFFLNVLSLTKKSVSSQLSSDFY